MTKIKYLNAASDLRRLANWLARNETSKTSIINKIWSDIRKQKEVFRIVNFFQVNNNPAYVTGKKQRLFISEQLLVSSNRLINLALKGR